jgi:hypothetical protein
MRKYIFSTILGCAALIGAGCEGDTAPVEEEAPPFPEGQGQDPNLGIAYPGGPYGVNLGSVVQNFKFVGFPRPESQTDDAFNIQLADFYNPSGEDVWPEGSPYGAGTPKPKALWIIVSAVWCGPCNAEAKDTLPGKYDEYAPQGVEFLLNLADGPTPGVPAEFKHLDSWVGKYETKFPAVIDPSYKLSALFQQNAFPTNMLVDTTTMEIVEVVAGPPTSTFYGQLEDILGN